MKKGRIRITLAVVFGLASPVLLCSTQPGPAVIGVVCLIACLLCLSSIQRQGGLQ